MPEPAGAAVLPPPQAAAVCIRRQNAGRMAVQVARAEMNRLVRCLDSQDHGAGTAAGDQDIETIDPRTHHRTTALTKEPNQPPRSRAVRSGATAVAAGSVAGHVAKPAP